MEVHNNNCQQFFGADIDGAVIINGNVIRGVKELNVEKEKVYINGKLVEEYSNVLRELMAKSILTSPTNDLCTTPHEKPTQPLSTKSPAKAHGHPTPTSSSTSLNLLNNKLWI